MNGNKVMSSVSTPDSGGILQLFNKEIRGRRTHRNFNRYIFHDGAAEKLGTSRAVYAMNLK